MKAKNSPLFSHASDDWATPASVFRPLLAKYHFTLDGAANAQNRLLPRWLGLGGLAEDALTYDWSGEKVWINPPYSLCREFLEKATWEAIDHSVLSVVLIPSRTDTRYFHDFVWDTDTCAPYPWVRSLNFIKGRIRFVSSKPLRKGSSRNSAPFPSVVIEFGPIPY